MSKICRIGDSVSGTCNAPRSDHPRSFTGIWQTGSESSIADGLGIVRINDTGITDCGHTFKAVTGSSSATADGYAFHRVGDAVSVLEGGSGVSVTGSDTSESN